MSARLSTQWNGDIDAMTKLLNNAVQYKGNVGIRAVSRTVLPVWCRQDARTTGTMNEI
jgi:hypothetical protein